METKKRRGSKVISLFTLSFLVIAALALSARGTVSVAAAAPLASPTVPAVGIVPAAQGGEAGDVSEVTPETNKDVKVLLDEMTLVHLLSEQYGYARTACAGNGLNNIAPSSDGPLVLIPNAGDLSLDGSNVAIKLAPDGQVTFIPRVPGQRIRVPVDLNDKTAGEEVASLTFDEAKQMMAAGQLVWTARDQGPYGNGHGLPGYIATCDPQFDKAVFKNFEEAQKAS